MTNEVTENICGMEPGLLRNQGIINFLKTCDISILENALVYRNETMNQGFKDWVCRMNSEICSCI